MCLVVAGAMASARDAAAGVIVLDTCVRECTDEDLRMIGAFRRILVSELNRSGLVAEPRAVLGYVDGAPKAAIEDSTTSSRQLIDDLKLGVEHWVNGRYDQAASQLDVGLALARRNPGLVVSDPTLRQLIPRAHVGRSVSLLRLGRRTEAKVAIGDLVRTLPEQSILDSWGTEADKIFQLARKELEALGKGSLVVEVDDPSAIFYVNEAGQPHRSMFTATLHAGRYRILVQDASGRSRRFDMTVTPSETAMLRIEWRRELEFSSSADRVGFTFKTAAERAREGAYARHFASLARSELAVVVGRIRWRRHAAMVGTIYHVGTEVPYRVGVVPLTGDETAALRELAAFLFSPGSPAPNVTPLPGPPWEARASDAEAEPLDPGYPLGWALSAGTIAMGAVMVAAGDDNSLRTTAGYALAGVGLLGGVTTTILYLRRDSARPMAAVIVGPTRAGLFAGLTRSF